MRYPPLRRRPLVSFIVPFRDDEEDRTRDWEWLKRFWAFHFPRAEMVVGSYRGLPFSKAAAVNEAARRARGRLFVILDADCYLNPYDIYVALGKIQNALEDGKRLWEVPYRRLYRLNPEGTEFVVCRDPEAPYAFPSPPPPQWIEDTRQDAHYGHQWAALIAIMPRDAFWLVGGMDERFRGWGGEDAAFMKALDTLYCLHENTDNDVLHLWHHREGRDHLTRKWKGQTVANVNVRLAQRYQKASGDITFMRSLIDER